MRAGEGERETENVRRTAPSMEPNPRLNPMALSWNRKSDAQPTELPRHPQKVYFNKVLIISCDLLNTVLKGKNRTAMWMQNGGMCIGCHPCDSWRPRSCAGCSAQHHGRALYRIARVKCSHHKTNKWRASRKLWELLDISVTLIMMMASWAFALCPNSSNHTH